MYAHFISVLPSRFFDFFLSLFHHHSHTLTIVVLTMQKKLSFEWLRDLGNFLNDRLSLLQKPKSPKLSKNVLYRSLFCYLPLFLFYTHTHSNTSKVAFSLESSNLLKCQVPLCYVYIYAYRC